LCNTRRTGAYSSRHAAIASRLQDQAIVMPPGAAFVGEAPGALEIRPQPLIFVLAEAAYSA
jgi:hypothetical protein